jgi:arylsulfatase A-like enzyme
VLATLHETGLDENTVVIFTADHGDHDSAHRLEHKSTHYDESVRIPLIVRAPGMEKPGSVSEQLVCTGLDILPTVCDYAGVDIPAGLRGKSLRPFVEGKSSGKLRDIVYSETEMGYMVADQRYKYCAFDPDKNADGTSKPPTIRESLVDMQKDPGEMNNLAFDAQHKATVSRLRKAMGDWMEAYGVDFKMPA